MSVIIAEKARVSTTAAQGAQRLGMIGLVLIAGISLFFRTHNLLSLPIFTDEAIYLHWALDIWEQKTRAALLIPISDDGKQPLFMWLAGGAMQLVQDPLAAGRLVSAVVGVAATVGMYLAGRYLAGTRTGLIAATLYAVAPFTLIFDRMAMADGMVAASAAWVLCLACFIVRHSEDLRRSVLAGVGLGVVLGIAIWTKMTALFLIPFPLLSLLLLLPGRTGVVRAGAGITVGYVIFGAFALLLAFTPGASNIVLKTGEFSMSMEELLAFPVEIWAFNAAEYWTWIQLYLPSPLYWLVLLAVPWGLVFKRRATLLLVACWAVFAVPPILTGNLFFTTRYVIPSVIPLLLLAAELISWSVSRFQERWTLPPAASSVPSIALVLAVTLPSIMFDIQLLNDPSRAHFAETDRVQYVEGWPSGYGFPEVIELIEERAASHEGPVIVLSDHFRGLPYNGLAIYLHGTPGIVHHVDRHIFQGGKGIVEAWRSHNVPLLVVGNDGRNDLDTLERQVPEAELIGVFKKPAGRFSYRVYEIDLPNLR